MKTVYLLRHAKSSWDEPSLPDYERPLANRGRKAAPRMGTFMAREELVPARVLCSGARRAQETWALTEAALGVSPPVEYREDIYHAAPRDLLALLQALPKGESSVILVGHNPTFEDLALALVATGEPKALQRIERKYPTGALAILDFATDDWREVREGRGHLRDFVRPKDVK